MVDSGGRDMSNFWGKLFKKKTDSEEGWVYVGQTDEFLVYYDDLTIINRDLKQINVWIKIVFTNKGIKSLINDRKNQGLDITNWNKLSHRRDKHLYDYDNYKFKILDGAHYSLSGEILDFYDTNNESNIEWINILPESRGDIILIKLLEDYNIERQ